MLPDRHQVIEPGTWGARHSTQWLGWTRMGGQPIATTPWFATKLDRAKTDHSERSSGEGRHGSVKPVVLPSFACPPWPRAASDRPAEVIHRLAAGR
jgi:hypothetical protein